MTPLHRLLLKFIIRIQDPSQVQCLSRNVDLLTDSTSSPLWVLQLLPKKVLCVSLNSRILSAAIIPFSYAHICQFFLDPQGTHF